jgi:hypothetical protein
MSYEGDYDDEREYRRKSRYEYDDDDDAEGKARDIIVPRYSALELARRKADGTTNKPEFLIDGILDEEEMILPSGQVKAFKSWNFGAYQSLCVANGAPYFGQQTKKSIVLWIVGENKEYWITNRMQMVAKANDLELNENLIVIPLRSFMHRGALLLDPVKRAINETGCSLAIIDPVYVFQQGQENSNDDVKRTAFGLFKLINSVKQLSISGIMHQPKGDISGRSALDKIVGGGTWGRVCDASISISVYQGEEDCWQLNFAKRDGGGALKPVVYQWGFSSDEAKIIIRNDLEPNMPDRGEKIDKGKVGWRKKGPFVGVNYAPNYDIKPTQTIPRNDGINDFLSELSPTQIYEKHKLISMIEKHCFCSTSTANRKWNLLLDTFAQIGHGKWQLKMNL